MKNKGGAYASVKERRGKTGQTGAMISADVAMAEDESQAYVALLKRKRRAKRDHIELDAAKREAALALPKLKCQMDD